MPIFSYALVAAVVVAAYLRFINLEEKHIFESFAFGKYRINSLRARPAPELELQAAVYGTRLRSLIVKQLHINFYNLTCGTLLIEEKEDKWAEILLSLLKTILQEC